MYLRIRRLLGRLAQMPIDAEYATPHSSSLGQISRAQSRPARTTLAAPFTMMICQFNRDHTERVWRAQSQQVQSFLYRGSLPHHTQDGLCFQYVLQGSISKMMMGQAVRLEAGDACLIDMNCVHAELAGTCDAILFSIELRKDFFLPEMCAGDTVISRFIADSIQRRNPLNRYLIMRHITRGLTEQLFWLLEQSCQPELCSSASSPRQDMLFFELDHYIRAHLATVSAQQLTELFHYDRNYFNRLIRGKTGQTFSQYLRRLRLEAAAQLLAQSDVPIQEICRRIGYENHSFFYRIFEDETGQSPLAYRQAAQAMSTTG